MSVYTEHSDQEIEIEQIYNNKTNPLTTSKPKEKILQQLY
jgi:Ring finger domain